jgi:hypothetical protein
VKVLAFRRSAKATVALAVLSLACGDDGVEPTFCGGIPAALFDNVPEFSFGQLRPALVDASTRLVPELPEGPTRTQLATSLENLAVFGSAADEATCTEFSVAVAALVAIEGSSPPTPELASVRIVVELAGASLRAR